MKRKTNYISNWLYTLFRSLYRSKTSVIEWWLNKYVSAHVRVIVPGELQAATGSVGMRQRMAARQIQKITTTISNVVFVFSAFGIMIVDASPVDTQTVPAVPLQVSLIETRKYFTEYLCYNIFRIKVLLFSVR
jgi:hypothetical protein